MVFSVLSAWRLWPLNTKTTVQMLRMKDLEPHQKVIQAKYEKFGNDMTKKAEMQKELMAFYKKNGHNPMGGCLPMLLQMPVFFALWSMLNAVFELRHAPFIGWIHGPVRQGSLLHPAGAHGRLHDRPAGHDARHGRSRPAQDDDVDDARHDGLLLLQHARRASASTT